MGGPPLVEKENEMAKNLKKNADGYGYTYTDLAAITKAIGDMGGDYYQYIEPLNGVDYVVTVPIVNGEEQEPRRGCRVPNATLSGKANPAQEYGSALTYARRYSLLMAFGFATTDDDAAVFTVDIAAEVERIARERGMDMKKIMDHYHIDRLDQMTSAEYADFMKRATGGVNG